MEKINISHSPEPEEEKMTEAAEFRKEALDKASQHLAEALAEQEDTENMVEAVAFHYYIVKNLCKRLTKKLIDIDYPKDKIEDVVSKLIEIPDHDAVSVLLLNDRQMDILFGKAKETDDPVQYILDKLPDEYKPTIGFHATSNQIYPTKKYQNGREVEAWVVDGSEKDHRDNDLPMAYYSYDYTNLYRQNRDDFLYVVQSLPSHRNDPSNNWGRAPKLQIITELKQENIRAYIEKMQAAAASQSQQKPENKAA